MINQTSENQSDKYILYDQFQPDRFVPKAMAAELPRLKVVNLVATARIDCPIDLIKCTERLNGKYSASGLPNCVIASKRPRVTVMITGNGKLLFCGATTTEDIAIFAWKLVSKMYEKQVISKPNVTIANMNVDNIVCSYSLGYPIDIKLFHQHHPDQSVYQPQKISPVQWYPDGAGHVIVAYSTGELIVTGNRTLEAARKNAALKDWSPYRIYENEKR